MCVCDVILLLITWLQNAIGNMRITSGHRIFMRVTNGSDEHLRLGCVTGPSKATLSQKHGLVLKKGPIDHSCFLRRVAECWNIRYHASRRQLAIRHNNR